MSPTTSSMDDVEPLRVDASEDLEAPLNQDSGTSAWAARRNTVDLLIAAGLALAAPIAVALHPGGSIFRVLVTLPAILIVPGYLLIQAIQVPASSALARARHVVLALGVSFPLLALATLVTTLTPWGMQAVPIVVAVTIMNLALVGGVLYRRARHAERTPSYDASIAILTGRSS